MIVDLLIIFSIVTLLSIAYIKLLVKFEHGLVQQVNDRLVVMEDKMIDLDYIMESQSLKKGHNDSDQLLLKLQVQRKKMEDCLKEMKQLSSKLRHDFTDSDGQLEGSLKTDFNEIDKKFNETIEAVADIGHASQYKRAEYAEAALCFALLLLELVICIYFVCCWPIHRSVQRVDVSLTRYVRGSH